MGFKNRAPFFQQLKRCKRIQRDTLVLILKILKCGIQKMNSPVSPVCPINLKAKLVVNIFYRAMEKTNVLKVFS